MKGKSVLTLAFICSMGWITTGCSTISGEKKPEQTLIVDAEIQPLSRNEVIVAVTECETNNLRAVLIYGKRKVNGYTSDIVLDVTCAPKR
jgi:type IV secretory pathway TraG/TraD family ATPase VirD4